MTQELEVAAVVALTLGQVVTQMEVAFQMAPLTLGQVVTQMEVTSQQPLSLATSQVKMRLVGWRCLRARAT